MTSINNMIKQLSGMLGTKDLTDWEQGFIESVVRTSNSGNNTTGLSAKQVEAVERIYNKHFG